MIRRAAEWLANHAAGRDRADAARESATLHAGFLLAAVRAHRVHCHAHPDELAVTVISVDGVDVAACMLCLEIAGNVRRAHPKHRAVAA